MYDFDWINCWYPVIFIKDLADNFPYRFLLYDNPLVLFRDRDGKLGCLVDRCPHRAARLSDGQVIEGKLECLYHGWQFGIDGKCLHIPQLPQDSKIPSNACTNSHVVEERQGIVWIWLGKKERADITKIPTLEALENPQVVTMDYAIDLPYSDSYLIENVIDVAHIHIAHDGVRGGGKREYAKPLNFEIIESSIAGIVAKFSSMGLENTKLKAASVKFIAPNLILYESNYQNSDLISGLALYSVPLSQEKCRLLYRKYSNFWSWKETWKPRWLEHWNQNKILEQDMNIIVGQYAEIERSQESLQQLWLPIKTCDLLVLEYRKWLDKYGTSFPFYRGYSTAKTKETNLSLDKYLSPADVVDRFSLHTKNCSSCIQAYRVTDRLGKILVAIAISLLALAILIDNEPISIRIVVMSFFILAIFLVTLKIKAKFI